MSDQYTSTIEEKLPQKFLLKEVLYDIDGSYSAEDIQHLCGFSLGMISREQFLNSLFYIYQLGIFKSVIVDIIKIGQDIYSFKFLLRQHALLDYIKIDGFLRNKQRIKGLYVIESGDVFDEQKHRYSLENMKNHFKQQGYLNTSVYDAALLDSYKKKVLVSCGFALGSRFTIQKVVVTTNYVGNLDEVDNQHIQLQVSGFLQRSLEGKGYSSVLLEHTQKKLQAKLINQGFLDVHIDSKYEIQDGSAMVTVYVDVNLEKKREFVFWGNKFFKNSEILSHLLLYGKSAWYFPLSIIEDEIETLYKNKGFFDVKVVVKENRQRVFCSILENARSKISSVSVIGAIYSNVSDITHEAFKSVIRSSYYDQDLLKKSLDNFIKLYKAAGFWDVKILRQELVFLPEAGHYEYVITLEEGLCRKLGKHRFKDNCELEQSFLKVWQKKEGNGFDATLLTEQKMWIYKYFKSLGYSTVSVEYELVLDNANKDVFDIVWSINVSRACVKFGQPIILGNPSAAYSKLLKECEFKAGDDWNKKRLDQTLQNFKDMKVFDSVQIYPGQDLDPLGYKPVFIKLQDIDRFEIKSTFGLQQMGRNWQLKRGFTYKVGASIGVNRLFTAVDKFCVYGDITRFYRDIGLTYDVPWIKNSKVRCQFKGYDVLYQKPVYIGSQDFLYKATRQGCMWNATRKFEDLSLSGSLGVQFLGLYEQDQPYLHKIIKYDRELLGKKIAYVFCEPIAIWRSVDNELNPRRGFQSFVSCKVMFDCNHKTTFCRVNAEYTQYIPIAHAATLALRARAGHVFNQLFEQIHPIERFYLGGGASIRGYMIDYCPPFGKLTEPIYDQHAGLPSCANDVWRYASQGGRTMFNLNAEMRFTVYKNLGFVLFNDWGALIQDSISQVMPGATRRNFNGSGAGVRYDTPIGPLRFDIGVKWHIEKPDFESRQVWYLSFGQAF
ncbi:BamA/TamA family outer membrane protein [Candidatus Dependentiae bacterium]|nr:BamA/TamA family outer membrane protein [Candidatus Dependentiae bacterium]